MEERTSRHQSTEADTGGVNEGCLAGVPVPMAV